MSLRAEALRPIDQHVHRRVGCPFLEMDQESRSIGGRLELHQVTRLKKHVWRAGGSCTTHRDAHQSSARREEEEFFAIAPPSRAGPAILRNARRELRSFKCPNVDLRASGGIRLVRNPVSIGREARRLLIEWSRRERTRLAGRIEREGIDVGGACLAMVDEQHPFPITRNIVWLLDARPGVDDRSAILAEAETED